MSEPGRPSYPPPGPQFPPGGYRPPPVPPRRPQSPLIIAVVAALVLSITVGVGRAVWPAASTALLSSPWAVQSAGLPPVRAPGVSSGPADASVLGAGVVDINTQLGYQNAVGAGTGIVLSPSGEVLTNNHVINGATTISVTDVRTGRVYPATVLGYDHRHDIALLQLRGASGLSTASIGDSGTVAISDQVAVVGNAGGIGGPPSIAPGTVSALDRTVTATDGHGGGGERLTGLIQVEADVVPGDSGGPLVNAAGQVVGVDTAASSGFRLESASGEGFAIPINQAMAVAKQIEAGAGSSTVHIGPTGVLGIIVEDTSAPGVTVVGVLPGSPGERAGLAAGDTIVAVDNAAIDSTTTLTTVMNGHHPGDSIPLAWLDPSGQSHDATVRLATGPPN